MIFNAVEALCDFQNQFLSMQFLDIIVVALCFGDIFQSSYSCFKRESLKAFECEMAI